MRKAKVSIVVAVIALSGAACVSGDKDRQPVVDGSRLQGEWVSACLPNGTASMAKVWTFSGDGFMSSAVFYRDASCQDNESTSELLSGTFTLAGPAVAAGAVKINLRSTDSADVLELFDLVSVEGDVLRFGNFAGKSEADRPAELNPSFVYQKIR